MELCSRNYVEMFKQYASEPTQKALMESHKLKHPNQRKSRHSNLTEEQLETKKSMEEMLLSKYGNKSVELICEVSSVREPPPPRYPVQYPMKLCS